MNRADLKAAIEWADMIYPACPHNDHQKTLIEAAKILSKHLEPKNRKFSREEILQKYLKSYSRDIVHLYRPITEEDVFEVTLQTMITSELLEACSGDNICL